MASKHSILMISREAISLLKSTVKKSPSNPAASRLIGARSLSSRLPYINNVTTSSRVSLLPPLHRRVATARMTTASTKKVYKWSRPTPMTLTFYFHPTEENAVKNLSSEEIKPAFKSALARWSEVIPVDFAEVKNSSKADIKIGFYRSDEHPFNTLGANIFAYAEYPRDGKVSNIYMKLDTIWAVDFDKEKSWDAYDLESMAVHEIGHILGLDHSENRDAVMCFGTHPRSTKYLNLRVEDAKRAQELYGSRPYCDLNILERRLMLVEMKRRFHTFSTAVFPSIMVVVVVVLLQLLGW